ncbi:MAG TPA: cytochrome c maturation protein CcmE [Polyangiaceae bacterium]|nr:cytochrome c maturation protein CcmE [Polyangiaceae bacterium]
MPDARPAGDRWLMLGLVATVLAVTAYVALARPSAIYSIGAEQAISDFTRYAVRKVRVRGLLVPGSLRHHSRECGVDVDIASNLSLPLQSLHVRYEGCSLPDVLCDLSGEASAESREIQEAHFEGQLVHRNGHVELVAEQVMVKCAAKYVPPDMAALCARYRTGDYCPPCEHVLSARSRR